VYVNVCQRGGAKERVREREKRREKERERERERGGRERERGRERGIDAGMHAWKKALMQRSKRRKHGPCKRTELKKVVRGQALEKLLSIRA
jgi:hypothetical protein